MRVPPRFQPLAGAVLFVLAGVALLASTDLVPFLLPTNLVFLTLLAIAATGLVLIMGFAGQVSIGHAAFYGIGAYATAIGTADLALPPFLALLLGLAVSAAVAAVLGRAVFRLSGHFLAMGTLAFGLFFFYLLTFAQGVTGGNAGKGGIPDLAFGTFYVTSDTRMFGVAWLVLGLGILVARQIVDSPTGRALRATGASEVAAACSGVNVVRAKVGVFVLGALYASLAGSLYAHAVSYIAPDAFGLIASVQLLVIATVGGLRSVWGGLVGALFVTLVSEGMREVVPLVVSGAAGPYEIVAYGGLLVVVLVAFRKGIADAVGDLLARRPGGPVPLADGGQPTPTTEPAG
jgi:branched-chain amino acid transport system permease protein